MRFLLALQLFSFPVTNAYAQPIKDSVVVAVTYSTEIPTEVCVFKHDLDDPEMKSPVEAHCWKPKNIVGDLDSWPQTDLDAFNFEVVVKYANSPTVIIYLLKRVDT